VQIPRTLKGVRRQASQLFEICLAQMSAPIMYATSHHKRGEEDAEQARRTGAQGTELLCVTTCAM
jgi:hypothetical protein